MPTCAPSGADLHARDELLDVPDLTIGVDLHFDLAAAVLSDDLGELLHRLVQIAIGDERRTEARREIRGLSSGCGRGEQRQDREMSKLHSPPQGFLWSREARRGLRASAHDIIGESAALINWRRRAAGRGLSGVKW